MLDIETLCGTSCLKYRWYAQNTEMLIYSMLKSKYIHTCSNSELYNVVITHRAQGNNWTKDNFQLIVLYVGLLQ